MRSDEEADAEVERRLRSYKALRARLNLPPPDEESSRLRILKEVRGAENARNAEEIRRHEQEQYRKRRYEAWQHQVLATHEDVTIVREKGEVFSHTTDGEHTLLPPPDFPCELNELNEDLSLNTIPGPVVVDGKGYAWTRRPEIAFFSDDGTRLTVHWVALAHEPKYGWEYSHSIVQRVTWTRGTIDERLCWWWIETVEVPG